MKYLFILFILIPFLSYGQLSSPIKTDAGEQPVMLNTSDAALRAVWLCTNATTGEGKWSRGRTSFLATTPAERNITQGTISNLVYATVVTNDGLTYDTNTGQVTLPVGRWIVGVTLMSKNYLDPASFIQPVIEKNDAPVIYGQWMNGSTVLGYYLPVSLSTALSSDGDDKVNAAARGGGEIGTTNANDSSINQFWIEFQGE